MLRKRALLIFLTLAALGVAGCDVDDLTIIAEDGTLWVDTHNHHDHDGWDWWGFDGWWD
jgi:hypothetical protein